MKRVMLTSLITQLTHIVLVHFKHKHLTQLEKLLSLIYLPVLIQNWICNQQKKIYISDLVHKAKSS